jgi:hypothetical protein
MDEFKDVAAIELHTGFAGVFIAPEKNDNHPGWSEWQDEGIHISADGGELNDLLRCYDIYSTPVHSGLRSEGDDFPLLHINRRVCSFYKRVQAKVSPGNILELKLFYDGYEHPEHVTHCGPFSIWWR